MNPPPIEHSTREERQTFIRQQFPCIADCDQCGLCAMFHGHDAEFVYADYIDGTRPFMDITLELRR
ncbi:MAG: hypothetical protein IJV33_08905 [Bacteroidaceae bacterium]|nr:hypothetical protein [Bacteroidaceae bacterium]